MEAKKTGEPGWTWRRSVLIGIIVASFGLLCLVINGPDTRVNETLGVWLMITVMCCGFIYAGFATVQDVAAIITTKSGLPYSPQSSPSEATPGTAATPTIDGPQT